MSNGITHPATQPTPPDTLQNWIMLVLTLILISLHGAGLIGWLKPPEPCRQRKATPLNSSIKT